MEHRREARAMLSKTRAGRRMTFAGWVASEYETLELLYQSGLDVPAPVTHSESAILMEYIGDGDIPAPSLNSVHLRPDAAQRIFFDLMRNVEGMLGSDRVHGDLSPFNVLYHRDRIRIIDFPQAVDPRFNPNAFELLKRDVKRLCDYFKRFGLTVDDADISRELWDRFVHSEL